MLNKNIMSDLNSQVESTLENSKETNVANMENVEKEMQTVENKVVEDKTEAPKEIQLVDVPITNENVALNVLVGFVNMAQKRGIYNVQESAKIWEAIQVFIKKQ